MSSDPEPPHSRFQYTGMIMQEHVDQWFRDLQKVFPVDVIDREPDPILIRSRLPAHQEGARRRHLSVDLRPDDTAIRDAVSCPHRAGALRRMSGFSCSSVCSSSIRKRIDGSVASEHPTASQVLAASGARGGVGLNYTVGLMTITKKTARPVELPRARGGSSVAGLCALLAVCLLFAGGSACAVDLDQVKKFDIPRSTPLVDALTQWSAQAHVQTLIDTATIPHQTTDGVRGTLSARKALETLLKNSGLSYEVGTDSVRFRAIGSGDPAPSMPRTGIDRTVPDDRRGAEKGKTPKSKTTKTAGTPQ